VVGAGVGEAAAEGDAFADRLAVGDVAGAAVGGGGEGDAAVGAPLVRGTLLAAPGASTAVNSIVDWPLLKMRTTSGAEPPAGYPAGLL
jgi:hypothetical protein